MIPKVLSIAGSDSSGGAGVQADLKTFGALGVYGMSAITALTAQNTLGVQGVYPVSADFLVEQLTSIFDDVPPDAIKIGMLGDVASIEALAAFLETRLSSSCGLTTGSCIKPRDPAIKSQGDKVWVVLDPVMVATSGDQLIGDEAVAALKDKLIPLADIVTPNLYEGEILLGRKSDDPIEAAKVLMALGAKGVLLKGGHGGGEVCLDVYADKNGVEVFEAPRLATKNTHGTGCTLSAAIAANLAKGLPVVEAIGEAKSYITEAIRHADELDVGAGAGPVHHFWNA